MAKLARSNRRLTREHTHSRSNGKPASRPRKYRRTLVPKTLQRSIAREASQLGLSVEEYVRMAIAISKSFRDTVKTDSSFDIKSVAKVVDSPIWPILMQTIGPVVTGMLESPSKEKHDTNKEQPYITGQPPAAGVPNPYRPYQQVPGQQVPGQQVPGQQVPGQQVPGQPWLHAAPPAPYGYW
ncbi:hypothetical protein [Alicyclobacillus ferrooxydans]|uniref:Uncharacterized protein n=1 Tax=Alicyclobacillus ferrooxydans TaxID=471514 RepID=A0A0P9CZY8_9BACL|nr:hypothetical protein [Alicyclobacillus ferrooxydans]KPV45308.1 hypothetical protein AN477_02795 [Alicyclobacillus ferrooxydans]